MNDAQPQAGQPSSDQVEGRTALLEEIRLATLGEFEILGELGRGGMAFVYLAHDIALDRRVAIKLLSPALFYDEEMVERFRREARLSAALSHPHIVPVHTVKRQGHLQYIVMKWIDGRSLDGIIHDFGPLSIRAVRVVLAQIGGALEHAHHRGIIHRDVKPGNIMVGDDGWAVISDFGIAKVLKATSLTTSGGTVGTPYYMSPEQCRGGDAVGPAADQYSLGCVAYEMLTGRPPFTGGSFLEVLQRQCIEEPIPITTLRPDCPPGLERLVTRMLAKTPEGRWPSCEAMGRALVDQGPVESDDPLRRELITLARSGNRELAFYATPASPVPSVRAGSPSARSPRAAGLFKRALSVVAGIAVIGVGALVAVRGDRTPGTADRSSQEIPSQQDSSRGLVLTPADSSAPPPADTPFSSAPAPVVSRITALAPVSRRTPSTPADQQPRAADGRSAPGGTPMTAKSFDGDSASNALQNGPGPQGRAWIRVGSKLDGVFLYINGVPHPLRALTWFPVQGGVVHLRVRGTKGDCADWVSTLAVGSGDSLTVGWRAPVCDSVPQGQTPSGMLTVVIPQRQE